MKQGRDAAIEEHRKAHEAREAKRRAARAARANRNKRRGLEAAIAQIKTKT